MDDDALSRIDRRTASTDDAVGKLGEILEEMRADGRRHDQVLEDQRQAIDDQRLAANQWNLRQERITREMLASWQELTASTQELTASIREWRYEGVAEARAQRAALFSILDQLKGGGPATA
ncbi:MAG TPA: hypothetical protein VGO80_07310 [Solirubrobacteraceae bacterium]|jgi:hypothetical protein|nr:hypothetical protein [Solirubrobacteraceae bacterium]